MNVKINTKPLKQIYNQLGLENKGRVQTYLDKRVAENLQRYVSYKTGAQEDSIPIASDYGSGKVIINVPYAQYQAYSKKITKKAGLRGTRPFERMKSDKGQSILNEVTKYARRLSK